MALRGHDYSNKARARVLKAARKKGRITSKQANKIGRWKQSGYHLRKLADAGYLRHAGYNEWLTTRRS